MQTNTIQTNGRPLATRSINIRSFEGREGHIVTEGSLQDDRHINFNGFSGEVITSGRFHTILARVEIDPESMKIEHIDVELQDAPYDACRELQQVYDQLVGLHIESGFTRAVLQKVGGTKGCAHLTHLIITMGPAIVQAAFTYQTRVETTTVPTKEQVRDYFVDSCYVWRADGDHAKKHS